MISATLYKMSCSVCRLHVFGSCFHKMALDSSDLICQLRLGLPCLGHLFSSLVHSPFSPRQLIPQASSLNLTLLELSNLYLQRFLTSFREVLASPKAASTVSARDFSIVSYSFDCIRIECNPFSILSRSSSAT